MNRFQSMAVFAKVVELGSFARAAERLGVSTSAASRQVSELEEHLGTRLLNRTTRRLSLTESGAGFHERCVQLLADLDEAEQMAATNTAEPRGTLKLTCGISWGMLHLPAVIAEFTALHPGVQFDVDLSDRVVDLVEEGYDLAIRVGSAGAATLVARPFASTAIVACASPDYLRRAGSPRHPRDLSGHACLRYTYSATQNTWHFTDRLGHSQAVAVRGSLIVNNGDLTAMAAVLGMGIAFEPDFIVERELAAGRLVRVLPDHGGPILPIQAVYPSRRHLSGKVRSFVDFLIGRFRDGPARVSANAAPGIVAAVRPRTRRRR